MRKRRGASLPGLPHVVSSRLVVTALAMLWVCPFAEAAGGATAQADEKTSVAVLWLEDRTADPEAAHWRYSVTHLLMQELDLVDSVRLRTAKALDYAFAQSKVGAGTAIDADKAQQMGQLIEAQRVVWGHYRREGQHWCVGVRVLNTATGESSDEWTACGSDWYDVRDRLIAQALGWLKITPSAIKREKMGGRGTTSEEALTWFSKGRALQQDDKAFAEQERCARAAIAADPNFAYAHAALAATLGSQGKLDQAEAAVRRALKAERNFAVAHQVLGYVLMHEQQFDEAEQALQEALRLDSDDVGSVTGLAQVRSARRDYQGAIEYLHRAQLLDPFAAEIRATLGITHVFLRNRAAALEALQKATQLDPQGRDLNAMLMVCQAHRLLGDVPRAIEGYERVLDQARGEGVNPRAVEQFEAVLTRLKGSLRPVFVEASMPTVYSAEQLQRALRERLTEEELAAVVKPLEGSEEMAGWARELAGGAATDLDKARALFDGLTRRIDPETDHSSRTAGEVFAAWSDPMESFNCQEYTKLFLVLAREVDVKAFYVHLDVDHAGRAVNHDCAIVFADGKALLVDPAYRWFGAPHRNYVVLDDVQVIAHQHFQSAEVDSCKLASKLHRDFAWGQRRLVMSLMAAGRADEAREVFRRAAELEPDHWETCRLQGIFALEDKDAEAAGGYLRKALAANPRDADSHMLLAMVLAQAGQPAEAREHARASLRHGLDSENAQSARRLIARINERIGFGDDPAGED